MTLEPKNANSPLFSIVVPTRNRPDTLQQCLETCRMQGFQNYEVIVSDNGDALLAQDVVAGFNDARYKYVRPDHVLAMSNNFEFATAHATGEYIIVIGDDDGLMPYALEELEATILQYDRPKVIAWEHLFYHWPSSPNPRSQNATTIPVSVDDRWVDGHDLIQQVMDGKVSYILMPMLYHRAIHKDVIAELKQRTGRVYDSRSPDVYTGYAIAHLQGQFLYKGLPCSISGISGKSNGAAHVLHTPNKALITNNNTENFTDGMLPHPKVPDTHCLMTAVAESFEYFRDNFFSDSEPCPYTPNAKAWLTWQMVMPLLQDAESQATNLEKLQAALPHWQDEALTEWVNAQLVPNVNALIQQFPRPSGKAHFTGQLMCFDALAECGVQDVAMAAQACTQVLLEVLSPSAEQNQPSATV